MYDKVVKMGQKEYKQKLGNKITEYFKKAIDLAKKGKLDDKEISKMDSIVTEYYKAYKRQ